jgi:hypothetical protein
MEYSIREITLREAMYLFSYLSIYIYLKWGVLLERLQNNCNFSTLSGIFMLILTLRVCLVRMMENIRIIENFVFSTIYVWLEG